MRFRLAPSILSADFAHLARDIRRVREADWLHIDVMDGHFVPNITIGPPVLACISAATELPIDVHLMIEKPSRLLSPFLDAGASHLTLHVESDTPQALMEALRLIREKGAKPGITLRPDTPVTELIPYLPLVDLVLIMTVEPGFGGQAFLPASLEKIHAARVLLDRYRPDCELEVDGGITTDTIHMAAAAGANVFVAGSAVFGADNVEAQVGVFRDILSSLR